MTSNYIRALALRHAALERQIETEMKAPLPDTLKIMRLKKLRLACRDSLRDVISRKRRGRSQRIIPSDPSNRSARPAPSAQMPGEA
ncbi:hypothetical protein HNE_1530 [Hyphomonas neptunium ATCC 15444]|uniref:DUF465 domain-containing protein n=2 Tax=Hyphomonas TaxID=85 RepID=Q0C202_HYPNA|nr:hypothetical protein HNE_1530 [Hyphomonas neptunium ATCC 15444]KCZ93042.1 hypothetical protein HHI_10154 [Hyphomonas hirschiana VP5]